MKKIIILPIIMTVIFLTGCTKQNLTPQAENSKIKDPVLKICPNEWIDAQISGEDNSTENRQYYILDGERREINEFDPDWVQQNCKLEKQVVW